MGGATQMKKKEKYIEGTLSKDVRLEQKSYVCVNTDKFKNMSDVAFEENVNLVISGKVTRISKDEYGQIVNIDIKSVKTA